MVNPAGYTALDMIGFTDQGTYSSSDNYVKNDLVHYSGNIWRCLIDDTSGIAPAEGANWTLFIGEPTNLVERIIAPVETDPATNAWAVGRQIIFNDNLYEVITAITAGDALVAYEDDPTNANIKLADPVETQLLNLKGNVSNRNLIDNAWFTVNQRGQSIYTQTSETYTVDRWKSYRSVVTVESDGISLAWDGVTSTSGVIRQPLENESNIIGKVVTLSAIVDGKLYKVTGVPARNTRIDSIVEDDVQIGLRSFSESETVKPTIIVSSTTAKKITAVKLELGSISTLAMDTAPNYTTELLKCQRYFKRIVIGERVGRINNGGTNIRFGLSEIENMRSNPTVTEVVDAQTGINISGAGVQIWLAKTTDYLIIGELVGGINLQLTETGKSKVASYVNQIVGLWNYNQYLDLSADL